VIDEDCARSFGGANAPFSRAWACGILAGVVHRRVGAVGHLAAVAARKAWRRGAAGRRLASLGCLAGLFCSHVAMAQTGQTGQGSGLPLRLTIDAPAGCPDRATFLAQVKGYAARVREASPGELAPTIHVEMRPGDADFRGILTVRDVDGEEGRREVRDVDCASVAAALAFVAAVVVDPDVARTANGAPAVRMAKGDAAPSAGAPAASAPSSKSSSGARGSPRTGRDLSSRSASRPPRLAAGAAIAGIEGLGPGVQIVPRLFVDLALPGPLERFDGRVSFGRGFTSAAPTAFGTARITLTDLRFEPCFAAGPRGAFRVGACGVVDVAILTGEGTNTTDPQTLTRRSVELGAGLRPTWILGDRVTLGLLVGAAVPMARYRFLFTPNATAYELAAWSGFAELSAGVYFW